MADRKLCHTLISKFEAACKKNGKPHPPINRNRARWEADSMLESMSMDEILATMDHYMRITKNPKWDFFAYELTTLYSAMKDIEIDKAQRAERMARIKDEIDEFRRTTNIVVSE